MDGYQQKRQPKVHDTYEGGDIKIVEVYQSSVVKVDGKCDTDIQRHIGIMKEVFQS